MDEWTRMMHILSMYVSEQIVSYNICWEPYSFKYLNYSVVSGKHIAKKFYKITPNTFTIFAVSTRKKFPNF
jgi:hypothetical protein